jgi:hypothetical protein
MHLVLFHLASIVCLESEPRLHKGKIFHGCHINTEEPSAAQLKHGHRSTISFEWNSTGSAVVNKFVFCLRKRSHPSLLNPAISTNIAFYCCVRIRKKNLFTRELSVGIVTPITFMAWPFSYIDSVEQCFSTAGPRRSSGPWHPLYWAAKGSSGICHFHFLSHTVYIIVLILFMICYN